MTGERVPGPVARFAQMEIAMKLPPTDDQCDVPGCGEPVVKRVGDKQKCAVHTLAAGEEWALNHDWRRDLLQANITIRETIELLEDGKVSDARTHWINAFLLLFAAHDTKRTLIQRGFFEKAGH